MTQPLNSSFQQTLTTLATAADIVANVVMITGNTSIGSSLKGQSVTLEMVRSLAMARTQRALAINKAEQQ